MASLASLPFLNSMAAQTLYGSKRRRATINNGSALNTSPGMAASNLCEVCHTRQKYVDASTGKTHPYCGKRCAATAASKPQQSTTTVGICVVCHKRPQYSDGSRTHLYCSRTCARSVKRPGSSSRQNSMNVNSNGICQIPDCNQPVQGTANGKYCGPVHGVYVLSSLTYEKYLFCWYSLAETGCLWCRQAPTQGDRHFCSIGCAQEAQKKAVILLEVPEDHFTFKSVADQFRTSWRHSTSCPPVKHIYKIVGLQSSINQYEAYKASVESRGQFAAAGKTAGNEHRRWHGTKRECKLGNKGETTFCSSQTCSLCCIIKSSFDVNLWGKKTGWGRFGAGIYTSSTSSKANDYSQDTDSNALLKAILLNKVVVGKGCKMTRDNTSLKAPPSGFDSVLAEKGDRLNHDELVVYSNDAIRPSYLVMYEAH
ncbi:ADP-ribosylation [Wolfiporia cocos MD-104 SS10]|uniref:ADP-ribosylation n=1 Tax=Wolfiporia cocos (strain MD-104) TaxID=742152 RepID=A0A2H3JIW7_WOLCO|nr:ADP-ribosylation [Wolfiporia cocos MD-104 SS10]